METVERYWEHAKVTTGVVEHTLKIKFCTTLNIPKSAENRDNILHCPIKYTLQALLK